MPNNSVKAHLPALQLLIFSLVVLTTFGFSTPANAAESVVLKYRFLQERVSVPELSTFAETGKLSAKLQFYLTLARREPEQLRRTLRQEVQVNPNFLELALNNSLGEAMLDQVSQVVHTPSNQANRESLRTALVNSARPDGRITLIETLENYPTSEVYVEGDRLAEVVQKISGVILQLRNLGF